MRIIVIDVAAQHGGALSILNEYYEEAVYKKDIDWIFVLSTPKFSNKTNIKIINYPWIKKSWIHRLIFDYIFVQKLIKEYKPDEILSLQNLIIPRMNDQIKQTIYIHQSLPFSEYRFKLRENKLFWFYQNIYGKMIINSIRKADHVIVQTEWMRNACLNASIANINKFSVRPPKININIDNKFKIDENSIRSFFYPANASYYKNHRLLIEASLILFKNEVRNFRIIVTLTGNENEHIASLYNICLDNDLPISFIGKISRKEVFDYYSKSILVFPSYIESSPVPLTEAKAHETIILASDCNFSREVLNDYGSVFFFKWNDANCLADQMLNFIEYYN